MQTYITKQGDTWDLLAYHLWGSEYLMTDLVEANQKYRHYIIFPSGIELVVPDIDVDLDSEDIPEWLEDDDIEDNDDILDEGDGIPDDEIDEID